MSDKMASLHSSYMYHMHHAMQYQKQINDLKAQYDQQWHTQIETQEKLAQLQEG